MNNPLKPAGGTGAGASRARLLIGVSALILAQAMPAVAQTDTGANAPAPAPTLVAQAAQSYSFDIPSKPLPQAITDFSAVTGLQVLYTEKSTFDRTAPALKGTYAAQEALRRLLAGSGLVGRYTSATAVTVERPGQNDSNGPIQLKPINVAGSTEWAFGPVDGYKAERSATATRTDTPISETPASIQVIPSEVIEDQGALNLKDVYENASGVLQGGNTLNAQSEVLPLIRGFESPLLLRNGLRATQVGAVDLVNVERVEVLKGPASILYGAIEPGGIVNYVTKRPQATPRYALEGQGGSFGLFRTSVDTTGPVTADKSLLYRFNAAYTNSDSFRDEIELERVAVAPSLLWQPTDRTDLFIDFSYLREEQPLDSGIPLDENGKRLVPRKTFFGDPDLDGREIEDFNVSYQLEHAFSDAWSVRNQFQYHRAEASNEGLRSIGVGGPTGNEFIGLRYQNEDRTDDELQFVVDALSKFELGPSDHAVLFGAELISQYSDFRRFRENLPPVLISSNVSVDFDPPDDQPKQSVEGESLRAGFYVQDQISLLSDGRLKLLLGGRYDVVRQEDERDGVHSPDVDDEKFSGRAAILYEFTNQYGAYASVSQSFNPQNPGTVDAGGNTLDPEVGLQYEASFKASFFDDRLSATASVYQIEKEDVAVFDQAFFIATGEITFLPGIEQRSRGVEVDITGAITDRINVLANYSFTDTEVLENANDPDTEGERLGGVPKHKARLWTTFEFAAGDRLSGLGFGGGVRYVGESTAQFDNDVELDPYVVVDAAAWYRWKAVDVRLNVLNLFDEDYIVRASDRAIGHPGEPLTVIGSLRVRF